MTTPCEFELKTVRDIMGPLDAKEAGIPWNGLVLMGRLTANHDVARWVWLPDLTDADAVRVAADDLSKQLVECGAED